MASRDPKKVVASFQLANGKPIHLEKDKMKKNIFEDISIEEEEPVAGNGDEDDDIEWSDCDESEISRILDESIRQNQEEEEGISKPTTAKTN